MYSEWIEALTVTKGFIISSILLIITPFIFENIQLFSNSSIDFESIELVVKGVLVVIIVIELAKIVCYYL